MDKDKMPHEIPGKIPFKVLYYNLRYITASSNIEHSITFKYFK